MADKRISQLVERVDIANNDVVPIVASGATTTNKATISSIQTFMQENLDVGVTSVGITIGTSGTDVSVTGSPVTTSGNITINIPTASATNRGLLSAADWITFNNKQDAGSFVTLNTTQTITAQKTFTTSGSSDTMIISHGSGSGFALDVLKAGNNEALRVTKTSGSGNAMTVIGGNFEAPTIVKTGGTSSQFLKADGSVDSNTYLTTGSATSTYVPYSGAAASVNLGVYSITANAINSAGSGSTAGQINLRSDAFFSLVNGYGSIASGTTNQFNLYQTTGAGVFRGAILSLNSITESATRTYTLPNADGTLALSTDLGAYLPLTGGTLTGALNGTSATFSTEVTSSGGQGRFGGWATGAGYQGNALEVGVSGGNAFMIGYNRTSGSYIPLSIGGTTNQTTTIGGSSIVFQNNGVTALTIASTGAATFTGALNGTSAVFTANEALTINANNSTAANNTITGFSANLYAIAVRQKGASAGIGGTTFMAQIIGAPGSEGLEIYTPNSKELILGTNSVPRLTLASTGAATFSSSVSSVGLSVTGSNGAIAGTGLSYINNSDDAFSLVLNNAGTSAQNDRGVFDARVSGNSVFRINNSGSVGIGTASPNDLMEIKSSTANQANYRLYNTFNDGANSFGINWFRNYDSATNSQGAFINYVRTGGSSGDLAFGTGTVQAGITERMRITSGGYLKVSNTGSYDNTSSSSFEFINNTAGGNSLLVRNINTSYTAALLRLTCDRISTNAAYYLIIATNGNSSGEFRVADSGNVTNTNNSYGAISDIKLKENIEDATQKLDDLMKVKVRNYNLIGDDKKQIGVIAQELEEVFPAMIDESEDFEEVEVPQLDEEGNEVLNEEGEVVTEKQRVSKGTSTKSVKYSVFVPMLIKAMQEQQEQIKVITEQIDSLKNQMQ